jgi:hypothetical protein
MQGKPKYRHLAILSSLIQGGGGSNSERLRYWVVLLFSLNKINALFLRQFNLCSTNPVPEDSRVATLRPALRVLCVTRYFYPL